MSQVPSSKRAERKNNCPDNCIDELHDSLFLSCEISSGLTRGCEKSGQNGSAGKGKFRRLSPEIQDIIVGSQAIPVALDLTSIDGKEKQKWTYPRRFKNE